jgi:hypothetical protein
MVTDRKLQDYLDALHGAEMVPAFGGARARRRRQRVVRGVFRSFYKRWPVQEN